MKKLMNFSDSALTRSEMKNVKGGCYVQLPPSKSGMVPGANTNTTVGKVVNNGSFSSTYAAAKWQANQWGTHFCCSSCSTASWCKWC